MASSRPQVSIIVPTHNRRDRLLSTLDALRRQTFPAAAMECIVVADGCQDDTVDMVAAFPADFAIRLITLDGSGPAVARNRGAEIANGELLLLLDDDVEPQPAFVASHVQAHANAMRGAALGPYPPFPLASPDPFRLETRRWWQDHFAELARAGHRFTFRDVLTGNLSIPASLWREIGGLDEAFSHAREDWEFGVRLLKNGVELIYAPGAFAWHHEHETSTFEGSYRRAEQEGRSDVRMAQKHPELADELAIVRATGADLLLLRLLLWFPPLASAINMIAAMFLRAARRHRIFRFFRVLHGVVRKHHYLLGAAAELKSIEAWRNLGGSDENRRSDEISIDLADGLDQAARQLAERRPRQVRLMSGDQPVAVMPAREGAEPWDDRHLRPFLANEGRIGFLRALRKGEAELPASHFLGKTGFQAALNESMAQWQRLDRRK